MNEDMEIQHLMEQVPMSEEASPELKRRLRNLAGMTRPRRNLSWMPKLAAAGAAAAGVVAVIMLTVTPTRANAFDRILQATQKANTFEFSVVSNEGGESRRFVIAAEDGRVGMRSDEGDLLQFDSGKMQTYDPKENVVTILDFGGVVDPKAITEAVNHGLQEGMQSMNLRQKLEEFKSQFGEQNIHIGPIQQKFGRSFYEVEMQKPGEHERVHMTVNAENDLPESIRVDKLGENGTWDHEMHMEMKFGGGVDIDLAHPKFPADAKRVELDLSKMIKGMDLKGLQDLKNLKEIQGLKELGRLGGHDRGDL